jgi:hypothetical protein
LFSTYSKLIYFEKDVNDIPLKGEENSDSNKGLSYKGKIILIFEEASCYTVRSSLASTSKCWNYASVHDVLLEGSSFSRSTKYLQEVKEENS